MGIMMFTFCKQNDIVIVTSFPIEKRVEYSVFDTYDIIDPMAVAVSNKYLFLVGMYADPIFQQYELPEIKYIRSFGRRGRGPNEFVIPPIIHISRNQEKLYFCRPENRTFTAYLILENGDLLQENEFTTRKGWAYNQFHIIKDSLLVYNILASKMGIEKIDLWIDKNSDRIEFTKNRDYSGESFFHPNWGILSVNDRYIIYAYVYRKQIDIYDIETLELKVRLLTKGHRESITTSKHSKRYYNDVYVTDNFIYAYYIDPDTDDVRNKYFIEVFDFNGTPLKRYNMGIHVGGGLFAVSPDDSVIYSYSTTLDKILKFDIAE